MRTRTFHVQGAELKGLFLAQLPQRLARLKSRGDRLQREGWDINTLHLLGEDASSLSSACRDLEVTALADHLAALAATVEPLFDPPQIPAPETGTRIRGLLDDIVAQRLPEIVISTAVHADAVVPGAAQDRGFPLLVTPPAQYWTRFAALLKKKNDAATGMTPPPPSSATATPAPSTVPSAPAPAVPAARAPVTPAAAPATEPAPAARPPATAILRKSAYHLGRGEPPAAEIDRYLAAQGYEVTHFHRADELQELLVALPPQLIVVDAAFESALEEIGVLVKRARADVSERIRLVQLSGDGELSARLRAVRAGCDAFITLPARPEDVIARIAELAGTDGADPYRVMIVEDDRSQALFAESILRKAGMETLAIGEGLSALDELDRFRPELILMDLYMPDCDGMELTALIREREAFLSTPIVFLSGEHDTDKHFEALNAGGDDFLSKPIRPKHLISAVTNRARRARQQNARRLSSTAITAKPAADGTVARDTLLQRLAECLAMEDARTRAGGLLVIEPSGASALRERLGNEGYDALLDEIGQFLIGHVGTRDMVARDGSSGFLLFNPDRETAILESYAANIRDRVSRETFASARDGARVLLDAGVCPFTAGAGDARTMLDSARSTIANARDAGRSGVFMVRDATTTSDTDLAHLIRFALDGAGLQLLFQPIVSLHGEEAERFQALLRLQGDDGRQYVAAELVPVAERAGVIAEVDRWVFEHCVEMIISRASEGQPPRLFLSQSIASARDARMVEWMREVVQRTALPPHSISLEIAVRHAETAVDDLAHYAAAIHAIGLTLTLSGFEAGETGDKLLAALPVDFVKLSPRYLRADGDAARAELRALVDAAHARGIEVIAPRVEDARGAAALWSVGVDFIQGNFVQRAGHDLAFDFHASVM